MTAPGIVVGSPDAQIVLVVGDPLITSWDLPDVGLLKYAVAEARHRYGLDVDLDAIHRKPR